MPPVYFLLTILIMVALHYLAPLARWTVLPWKWLGLFPVLVGIWLGGVANILFRRNSTTIKPFEESSALVTAGPYRFTRNPMYLGMVLVLVGTAILMGTVSPIVVIPLFAWLIAVRFIRFEEAMLEGRFGETFVDYKRRVRRWI